MKISGIGQICPWPAGSLWIGLARDPTDVHAHHAVQICLVLKGTFRLCTPTESWKTYVGAVIPSHQPHANETEQIGKGLYGAFIVRGEDELALDGEKILVLDDLRLDRKARLRSSVACDSGTTAARETCDS